ncbi:hypothetical protein I2I11_15280 [Pontibacter sp. 172403-2]|uniref:hypothetical protein n=1 Tax=Pontibacter rufus TaxID=2791028 RepID=UPI0018AF549B|nr:hypothetical protein [Pontibacter sp. 172403-2]MBF9254666.1 hypothetical protein [Pontibacter sp. 172403-2]
MKGNDWYNRTGYTDNRNHSGRDDQPVDEDRYRGAYRFDNKSADRNETTYDGFDRNRHPYRRADNPGNSRDFGRDRGGAYQNDWSAQDRNSRYQQGGSNSNQYRNNSGSYDRYSDRNTDRYSNRYEGEGHSGLGNFNPDYGPDHYRSGSGENYGNMAGSLSYGYDGTSNYNHDKDNYYDPLTGHHHSYHGNYSSRHPDFYNERERRRHQDDFRPLGR